MSYSRKHAGETGSLDGAPLFEAMETVTGKRVLMANATYSNRPDGSNDVSLAGLEEMMADLARANASHEAYQRGKAGLALEQPAPARADLWSTRVIAQADQARRCEVHQHNPQMACQGPGDRLVTRLVPRIDHFPHGEGPNHAWLCEVHMREMAHSWEWVPVRGRVTIADEPSQGRRR